MKKDELQSICREQESLLGALKTVLEEKQIVLDRALLTIQLQDEEITELRAEIDKSAALFRAEFMNLSVSYQNSIETLNRSWSTKFSELEQKLRASLEAELSSLTARLNSEDPNGYETMLMNWLTDFIKDLELSLSGS